MKKLFLALLVALVLGVCQPASAELVDSKVVGSWRVMKYVDEMDDKVTYVAVASTSLDNVNKITAENYDTFKVISLVGVPPGGCFIRIPNSSFTRDSLFFQYRLDKEPAKTSDDWLAHKNSFTMQKNSYAFAKELCGHKTLAVRVKGWDGDNYTVHTVKFDIAGVEDALKIIAKAAGWE